jgi:hypothetical protein
MRFWQPGISPVCRKLLEEDREFRIPYERMSDWSMTVTFRRQIMYKQFALGFAFSKSQNRELQPLPLRARLAQPTPEVDSFLSKMPYLPTSDVKLQSP